MRTIVVVVFAAAVAASGCARRSGSGPAAAARGGAPARVGAPPACRPPAGATPAVDTLGARAAGQYRLTLVADSGPRAGAAAAGRLTLSARPGGGEWMGSGPYTARVPLWGQTDVELPTVGARVQGSAASTDPPAPGVYVIEIARNTGVPADSRPAPRTGTRLTLGHGGNKDGARSMLYVLEPRPGGFGGRWESGSTFGPGGAAGYFCAERLAR